MRWRVVLLGMGLAGLCFAVSGGFLTAVAQAPGAPGATSDQLGLFLADRLTVQRLNRGKELLATGKSVDGVRALQGVLDSPEDGWYRSGDEKSSTWNGLKYEAERVLQEASPEVIQGYEDEYGNAARQLLKEAEETDKPDGFMEVIRRFGLTQAGAEAAYRLGVRAMDRGQPTAALQSLRQVRRVPRAASRLEPHLSVRMALCQEWIGQRAAAITELRTGKVVAGTFVDYSQRPFPNLDDTKGVETWLSSVPRRGGNSRAPAGPEQWWLTRGNWGRTGESVSQMPFSQPLWTVSRLHWRAPNWRKAQADSEVDLTEPLQALEQINREVDKTPLPAGQPLVVNGALITRSYSQTVAYDLKNGKELWRSVDQDRTFTVLHQAALETEESRRNTRAPASLVFDDVQDARVDRSLLLRQRAWEDQTYGTLSSDGERLFVLEDLTFHSPHFRNPRMFGQGVPHPLASRDYNRLVAYEARTGRLKWEIGGPRLQVALDLAGTFFLGPPVPWQGQLFCLGENNGEVRLYVMEAATGAPLWSQTLIRPDRTVLQDARRRQGGLSPAIEGRLIICPTGGGAVIALDLETRKLVWAHSYIDPNVVAATGLPQQRRFFMPSIPREVEAGTSQDYWCESLPILVGGRVIFTPRDSESLLCLDLNTGKPLWSRSRGDGKYVAGVIRDKVVIVGERTLRALNLADGETGWGVPSINIGPQTGTGVLSGSRLILPLVNPRAVVVYDAETGRMVGMSPVRTAQDLGNLVATSQGIFSQSPTTLVGLRSFEAVIAEEVTSKLKQDPEDAEALAIRGEYRLLRDEIEAGRNDLRLAVRKAPSPAARRLLFENLLADVRRDFGKHQDLLPELSDLATELEFRQQLNHIWSEGLRGAGSLAEAWQVANRDLEAAGTKGIHDEYTSLHSVRRERGLQSLLRDLRGKSPAVQRDQIDGHLKEQLATARRDESPDKLRRMLRYLGNHPLADEARWALIEKILPEGYTLEVEKHLLALQRSENLEIAGKALAMELQEVVKLDRLAEAKPLIRRLREQFATVACLPGKTGEQLANEWLTRSAVNPHEDSLSNWPTGPITVNREEKPGMQVLNQRIPLSLEGPPGPHLENCVVAFDNQSGIVAYDGLGKVIWQLPQRELWQFGTPLTSNGLTYHVRGHVVIINMVTHLLALDTLRLLPGKKVGVAWSANLVDTNIGEEIDRLQTWTLPRPGRPSGQTRTVLGTAQNRILGEIVDVSSESVLIRRNRTLILLDLLTGAEWWRRSDIVTGMPPTADDDYIFLVPLPMQEQETALGKAWSGVILSRIDGRTIGQSNNPMTLMPYYQRGRWHLGMADTGLPGSPVTLRMLDLWEKRTAWHAEYPPGTTVQVLDEEQVAVLVPTGAFELRQLHTGKVIWIRNVQPAVRTNGFFVLEDGPRMLVLHGVVSQNFLNNVRAFGLSNQLVEGRVDCLERGTGKSLWSREVATIGWDWATPRALPCLVLAAQVPQMGVPNAFSWRARLLCIDKRTGKEILSREDSLPVQTMEVEVDPTNFLIEMRLRGQLGARYTLKYTPAEEPKPE